MAQSGLLLAEALNKALFQDLGLISPLGSLNPKVKFSAERESIPLLKNVLFS